MNKRTAVIGALLSLLPMGQPLLIGPGAALTSAGVMLALPKKAQAASASYYYNRGIEKSDAGDYYGAIADYNMAIEINPRYADAYVNRGITKRKLKDYYGAIADYTKAIEINPRYKLAYYNRGNAKKFIGDEKGSCSDWDKASSLGDKIAESFVRDFC